MTVMMLRVLTFLLAIFLALPALAHSDRAPDSGDLVSTLNCDVANAEMADLLDDSVNREKFGSNEQHCMLHCAAIASFFEFDCQFESEIPTRDSSIYLFLQHCERIPRPPDVA